MNGLPITLRISYIPNHNDDMISLELKYVAYRFDMCIHYPQHG